MTKNELADAITQAIREDWQGGRVQELVAKIYGEQNEAEAVEVESPGEVAEEVLTLEDAPKKRGRKPKPVAEQ